jgi:hypothetical protein
MGQRNHPNRKDVIKNVDRELERIEKDQEWLDELVQGFEQMDQVIPHSAPPSIHDLEQLVSSHKVEIRRQNRLELLCFFIVACILIGGNTFLAMTSWTAFLIFQVCTFVGAISFLSYSHYAKKKGAAPHAE